MLIHESSLPFSVYRLQRRQLFRSRWPASIYPKSPANAQCSQSRCHAQAIPHDVQFAPLYLLPPNRHLHHRNRRHLRQHQHFHVKYPPFAVHVRDDVRQRCSAKELEAALRIFDLGGFWRGEHSEQHMEGMHQEVPQFAPSHHRLAVHQVCTAAHRDGTTLAVFGLLACRNQSRKVIDTTCTICVRENHVLSSRMPHSMGDSTALSHGSLPGR